MGFRQETGAGDMSVLRAYEHPRHSHPLVAMGPDRRQPLKARAIRAPGSAGLRP